MHLVYEKQATGQYCAGFIPPLLLQFLDFAFNIGACGALETCAKHVRRVNARYREEGLQQFQAHAAKMTGVNVPVFGQQLLGVQFVIVRRRAVETKPNKHSHITLERLLLHSHHQSKCVTRKWPGPDRGRDWQRPRCRALASSWTPKHRPAGSTRTSKVLATNVGHLEGNAVAVSQFNAILLHCSTVPPRRTL